MLSPGKTDDRQNMMTKQFFFGYLHSKRLEITATLEE
jgi:hypothetical protein